MKVKRIVIILLIAVLASLCFACDVKNELKGEEKFSCTIFVKKAEVVELNCVVLSGSESPNDFKTETALKPLITVKDVLDNLSLKTGFSYTLLENAFGTFIAGICEVEADSSLQYFACYLNRDFVMGDIMSTEIEDDTALIEFILANY